MVAWWISSFEVKIHTGAASSAAILSTGRLNLSILVDHHQNGTPRRKTRGKHRRMIRRRRCGGLIMPLGSSGVWIPERRDGPGGAFSGVSGMLALSPSTLPDGCRDILHFVC